MIQEGCLQPWKTKIEVKQQQQPKVPFELRNLELSAWTDYSFLSYRALYAVEQYINRVKDLVLTMGKSSEG